MYVVRIAFIARRNFFDGAFSSTPQPNGFERLFLRSHTAVLVKSENRPPEPLFARTPRKTGPRRRPTQTLLSRVKDV